MIQFLPLLALVAAPLENWINLGTDPESKGTLWVDRDSLREEAGLRIFNVKMSAPNGVSGTAIVAADCKTGMLDVRHSELIQPGAETVVRDFKPGEHAKEADDDIGRAMIAIACS